MILPKQITIFGNTIDVIEVDCLNEEMGDFSPITNTIHIARNTLSDDIKCELRPKQMEQTFWREVFHAFQYYATGEYDEAQSQVYAGFMSGLGIDIVVGETKIEPLILSLVSAGLRGDTLNAREVANELAEIASALATTSFHRAFGTVWRGLPSNLRRVAAILCCLVWNSDSKAETKMHTAAQ